MDALVWLPGSRSPATGCLYVLLLCLIIVIYLFINYEHLSLSQSIPTNIASDPQPS